MQKLLKTLVLLGLLSSTCYAQPTTDVTNAPLSFASGSVVYFPWKVIMPNYSVVDNGDGTITLNLITGAQASGYVINPMTTLGDIIYGGTGGAPIRYGIGAANTVLHANGTPQWSQVVEGDISLSNVVTNNANVARHGFLPTLSGSATEYLNGNGNFATPGGVTNSYTTQTFTNVASVSVVHNFGAKPLVQVLDSTSSEIIPLSVVHDTNNTFYVTFSALTTGRILATVGSPQPQSLIAVNADYTILTTDYIVLLNTAGLTATLPIATGNTGRMFIVDNATTGTGAVVSLGGCTIEGETSQTLPSDSAMHVYSNGSNWRII